MLANDFTTNGRVNIAIYNDYATITFISIFIFIFISQIAMGVVVIGFGVIITLGSISPLVMET